MAYIFDGNYVAGEYQFDATDATGAELKLLVFPDSDPQDPREWDNVSTFACWHRRYNLGDDVTQGLSPVNFLRNLASKNTKESDIDEMEIPELLLALKESDNIVIEELYLFDHSGLSISVQDFGDRWDSGMVGIAFVTKDDCAKAGYQPKDTADFKDWASRAIEAEVDTYDAYLSGSCYGYRLEDEDGQELDSCCGFYGDSFAENGILEAAGVAI